CLKNISRPIIRGLIVFTKLIGLVQRYGYPAEEHYVTTEDGYNLVIHRISGSPLSNSQQRRKVVFLQHGIVCTSDCWVSIGAGKDLGE
ncbi:lipase 3-like, partial [Temnothorax curvispinosus]|uniref:Lipase 3-like n=1 Tax=Temnothorax curvispinosus TaxID=300111 RepID=A0A6J1QI98_9HYME